MKKTDVDVVKTTVSSAVPGDDISLVVSNRDGSTFVSRESDKLELFIANNTTRHILVLEAESNFLGKLTFKTTAEMLKYLEAGTYLAEVVLTDSLGNRAIYPDYGYVEITLI